MDKQFIISVLRPLLFLLFLLFLVMLITSCNGKPYRAVKDLETGAVFDTEVHRYYNAGDTAIIQWYESPGGIKYVRKYLVLE